MDATLNPQRQRLLHLLRSQRMQPGSEIVADMLARLGVTHVFGLGGAPADTLLGACAARGLRVLGARHQQGAVLMSLAFNFVSGGLRSVVIVSSGPALTNCATGLLVGSDNCWPLLVIGGELGRGQAGRFQAFDAAGFFAPITKWSASAEQTDQLQGCLVRAAHVAMSGRPGPVYLGMAAEALAGRADASSCRMEPKAALAWPAGNPAVPTPDPALLHEAVSLLVAARRPAMLIGKGARWSEPGHGLARLADDHRIAFAATPMGRGLLPDDHPLCFGAIRPVLLAEADVVLVVGARFDWTLRFGQEIASQARVVHIDIDPDEAANVLGRGVALHGDAAAVVDQLLAGLDAQRSASLDAKDRGWHDDLRARCDMRLACAMPDSESGQWPMSPYEWLAELGRALPADAITVLDGNVVMTAAQRMLPVRLPLSRLGPATNGCMGVGIPFAIGAKLARPEAPVVAIVGDFSFGLSAIELETAVRHRVPLVVVVANNAGPGGSLRQLSSFPAQHPERVLQFGTDIRYDQTMVSLGGHGRRVERPGELSMALAETLALDQPACIDVLTNERTAVSAAI